MSHASFDEEGLHAIPYVTSVRTLRRRHQMDANPSIDTNDDNDDSAAPFELTEHQGAVTVPSTATSFEVFHNKKLQFLHSEQRGNLTSELLGDETPLFQSSTPRTDIAAAAGQQTDKCTCIAAIDNLYRQGHYVACVDYASTFLEQLASPLDVSLSGALSVLRCLSWSLIRTSEVERARLVLGVWCELLEQHPSNFGGVDDDVGSGNVLPFVQRCQWAIRYQFTCAELCIANGEREEAIQALVLAWRTQAYMYGPESLIGLKTYLRIAELKVELAKDTAAADMLRFAQDLLCRRYLSRNSAEGDSNVVDIYHAVFTTIQQRMEECDHTNNAELLSEHRQALQSLVFQVRLHSVIMERQRKTALALRLLQMCEPFLTEAIGPCATHASSLLYDAAMIQFRVAELWEHSSGGGDLSCEKSNGEREDDERRSHRVIEAFASGVKKLELCLPPESKARIRARLRLARYCANCKSLPPTLMDLSSNVSNVSTADIKPVNISKGATSDAFVRSSDRDAQKGRRSALISARNMVEEILHDIHQSEVRGGRHVDSLIEVYEVLGFVHSQLGDHRQAAVALNRARSAASQLFAPDHERCAVIQLQLADALMSGGHLEDAYHLLRELHEWCVMCPAGRAPPVPKLILQHQLGNVMRLSERWDEALTYYRAALEDPEVDFETAAKILGNMAAMELTRGNTEAAIVYNRNALHLRIQRLGEQHPSVAASYANLASLYRRMGHAKEVWFHAERSLQILDAQSLKSGSTRKSPSDAVGATDDDFYRRVHQLRAWAIRAMKDQRHVKRDS